MTVTVQIPPATTPVLDAKGYMTQPWRTFFTQLVTRAGGIVGELQPQDPTLDALAALNAAAGVLRQTGADTFTKTPGVTGTKSPPASITTIDGIITAWT